MKIALIGDSMTEKWGSECQHLHDELTRTFSRTSFQIENYGLAGTRAGHGIWRISHDFKDSSGNYRSCVSFNNPDLVIIESFAYTNCGDDAESLSEYRDVLRRLWEEVQHTTSAKILFYVTIPPDRDRFLETSNNYFFTPLTTRQRLCDRATLYLEEAIRIANDEGWPLANVYNDVKKRVEAGDKIRRYINQSDCIHPSTYGFAAVARIIARTLDERGIIQEAQHS